MRKLPLAAAATITAAATLGLAAPAFAAGSATTAGNKGDAAAPATLPAIQAKAAQAISMRVAALNTAIGKVKADTSLGTDQAALLSTLQGDVPSLQALGQKIAADTTVATAAADYEDIFSQYRVFALVLPVTRLVATNDRITTVAVPKLTAVGQKLTSHETSADSAQVQPLVADLTSKVAAAQSATSGLSATLLALTPSQYDANHAVLTAPKATVKTAVGDLKAAAADAKQARTIEVGSRAGHSHTGHAGTSTAPTTGSAPAGNSSTAPATTGSAA